MEGKKGEGGGERLEGGKKGRGVGEVWGREEREGKEGREVGERGRAKEGIAEGRGRRRDEKIKEEGGMESRKDE